MDQRLNELTSWVIDQIRVMGLTIAEGMTLSPVSGDASFRRYFRAYGYQGGVPSSFIVMDAPPTKESSDAYVHVASALEQQGLCVPHLFAINRDKGFLLLSDLGDELYLNHLTPNNADGLYEVAMDALLELQQCTALADGLPLYDEHLLRTEMSLFNDWFCDRLLNVSVSDADRELINHVFLLLINNALIQPQVCVHRDYHSRNLMLLDNGGLGILDFQDAVKGAITYDLVSLLKDCYIAWPREKVENWVKEFLAKLRSHKQLDKISDEEFLRWFDWMGIQRHLKVLGIFSRLNLRDHKPRYLKDIPLVLDYVIDTTARYDEFSIFHQWLSSNILPAWKMFFKDQVLNS